MTNEKLLKQEVEELTELLRNDPNWSDLRKALSGKNLKPDNVLLAGFIEDEEENEFGAIITQDGKVYEYERNTSDENNEFSKWQLVEDINELLNTFEAIDVAIKMIKYE